LEDDFRGDGPPNSKGTNVGPLTTDFRGYYRKRASKKLALGERACSDAEVREGEKVVVLLLGGPILKHRQTGGKI